jgi:uncharacterized protein
LGERTIHTGVVYAVSFRKISEFCTPSKYCEHQPGSVPRFTACGATPNPLTMKPVADSLQSLASLQKIDTLLDRIRQIRGGLPEEVRDLEDEIEGLRSRIARLEDDLASNKHEIALRQTVINESRDAIRKYEGQMNDVKNNREFEALNKEIELAKLEIMTSERKIKQYELVLEERTTMLDEVKARFEERTQDLEAKRQELKEIVQETELEENKLLKESEKAGVGIEERLITAYRRIRSNMRNGLSVVYPDRGACGGCFALIPPQRIHEIRQKKRIIVCENCGRIIVDRSYFHPNEELVAVVN